MRAKPATCEGCPCHAHGTDFSAIEGSGASGVMDVAEASGEAEQRDCLPLRPYSKAGGVYQRALDRAGHRREQNSITNVMRCRPLHNWLVKSPWEYEAPRHCRPNLLAAIKQHRPRALRALGDVALRELTGLAGPALGVSHLTGYVLPGPDIGLGPIPTVASFHPSFLRHGKMSHFGVFARAQERAFAVAAGRDTAFLWQTPEELQASGRLTYITHPTFDDAQSYYYWLKDRPALTLSVDLETGESTSLDEDARAGFSDTRLELAQFSCATGEAIAMPWEGVFKEIIAAILALPNDKCGHNIWSFDKKVLEAVGEREGLDLHMRGTVHDTMCMFGHWQPDLPKHLQFCSQWVQFPFPWKHLAAANIQFYGCCDADATLRLFHFLRGALEKEGLWD